VTHNSSDHPAIEDFYYRAFEGSVTRSVDGYRYGGNWVISTGGLTPARTAASIAAIEVMPYLVIVHSDSFPQLVDSFSTTEWPKEGWR